MLDAEVPEIEFFPLLESPGNSTARTSGAVCSQGRAASQTTTTESTGRGFHNCDGTEPHRESRIQPRGEQTHRVSVATIAEWLHAAHNDGEDDNNDETDADASNNSRSAPRGRGGRSNSALFTVESLSRTFSLPHVEDEFRVYLYQNRRMFILACFCYSVVGVASSLLYVSGGLEPIPRAAALFATVVFVLATAATTWLHHDLAAAENVPEPPQQQTRGALSGNSTLHPDARPLVRRNALLQELVLCATHVAVFVMGLGQNLRWCDDPRRCDNYVVGNEALLIGLLQPAVVFMPVRVVLMVPFYVMGTALFFGLRWIPKVPYGTSDAVIFPAMVLVLPEVVVFLVMSVVREHRRRSNFAAHIHRLDRSAEVDRLRSRVERVTAAHIPMEVLAAHTRGAQGCCRVVETGFVLHLGIADFKEWMTTKSPGDLVAAVRVTHDIVDAILRNDSGGRTLGGHRPSPLTPAAAREGVHAARRGSSSDGLRITKVHAFGDEIALMVRAEEDNKIGESAAPPSGISLEQRMSATRRACVDRGATILAAVASSLPIVGSAIDTMCEPCRVRADQLHPVLAVCEGPCGFYLQSTMQSLAVFGAAAKRASALVAHHKRRVEHPAADQPATAAGLASVIPSPDDRRPTATLVLDIVDATFVSDALWPLDPASATTTTTAQEGDASIARSLSGDYVASTYTAFHTNREERPSRTGSASSSNRRILELPNTWNAAAVAVQMNCDAKSLQRTPDALKAIRCQIVTDTLEALASPSSPFPAADASANKRRRSSQTLESLDGGGGGGGGLFLGARVSVTEPVLSSTPATASLNPLTLPMSSAAASGASPDSASPACSVPMPPPMAETSTEPLGDPLGEPAVRRAGDRVAMVTLFGVSWFAQEDVEQQYKAIAQSPTTERYEFYVGVVPACVSLLALIFATEIAADGVHGVASDSRAPAWRHPDLWCLCGLLIAVLLVFLEYVVGLPVARQWHAFGGANLIETLYLLAVFLTPADNVLGYSQLVFQAVAVTFCVHRPMKLPVPVQVAWEFGVGLACLLRQVFHLKLQRYFAYFTPTVLCVYAPLAVLARDRLRREVFAVEKQLDVLRDELAADHARLQNALHCLVPSSMISQLVRRVRFRTNQHHHHRGSTQHRSLQHSRHSNAKNNGEDEDPRSGVKSVARPRRRLSTLVVVPQDTEEVQPFDLQLFSTTTNLRTEDTPFLVVHRAATHSTELLPVGLSFHVNLDPWGWVIEACATATRTPMVEPVEGTDNAILLSVPGTSHTLEERCAAVEAAAQRIAALIGSRRESTPTAAAVTRPLPAALQLRVVADIGSAMSAMVGSANTAFGCFGVRLLTAHDICDQLEPGSVVRSLDLLGHLPEDGRGTAVGAVSPPSKLFFTRAGSAALRRFEIA